MLQALDTNQLEAAILREGRHMIGASHSPQPPFRKFSQLQQSPSMTASLTGKEKRLRHFGKDTKAKVDADKKHQDSV